MRTPYTGITKSIQHKNKYVVLGQFVIKCCAGGKFARGRVPRSTARAGTVTGRGRSCVPVCARVCPYMAHDSAQCSGSHKRHLLVKSHSLTNTNSVMDEGCCMSVCASACAWDNATCQSVIRSFPKCIPLNSCSAK